MESVFSVALFQASALLLLASASPYIEPLAGRPSLGYTASLFVGSPPQKISVIIDTGSSDLAIATDERGGYFRPNRSSSYQPTSDHVTVNYMSGMATGLIATDIVSMSSLDPINVSMIVFEESSGFLHQPDVQGILGLAYPGLSHDSDVEIPFFETLRLSRNLSNRFSLQLCGFTGNDLSYVGSMILNGMDSGLNVLYTPIKKELYYEVTLTGLKIDGNSLGIPCSQLNNKQSIVDSGTEMLLLPQNVYNSVVKVMKSKLNASKIDPPDSFWRDASTLMCKPDLPAFPVVTISLLSGEGPDKQIDLIIQPNMYLRARRDPSSGKICYAFGIGTSRLGSVLGLTVLEGYHVIFDRANKRIGFAESNCTVSSSDYAKPKVLMTSSRDTHSCAYQNLRGEPGKGYTLNMSMGTPSQWFEILLDTGSSNFAVAATQVERVTSYFKSDISLSYSNLRTAVGVEYTGGSWQGVLSSDFISSPGVIPGGKIRVQFAAISQSQELFKSLPMQGLLGLAYKVISKPSGSITPVFDTLVAAKRVENVFSMQLCGTVDKGSYLDVSVGGTMVFSGVDPDLYRGKIYYTPLKREWYYDVILTAMKVGDDDVDLPCTELNNDRTIVDSGTTSLRLPTLVYQKVLALIKEKTSTVLNQSSSFWLGGKTLYCWDPDRPEFDKFPPLTLSFLSDEGDDKEIRLRVLPQMYLQAYRSSEEDGRDCYKFSILSSISGTVIGAVVMEGYYVVFDRSNSRVGFARSTCEIRDSTFEKPDVEGPYARSSSKNCRYTAGVSASEVVIFVSVGIIVAAVVAIIVVCILMQRKSRGGRPSPSGSYQELNKDSSSS